MRARSTIKERSHGSTRGTRGYELGEAVAVSNGTALVAAPGAQVDGNHEQGLVHVYTRTGTGWTQAVEPTASDGAEGDRFKPKATGRLTWGVILPAIATLILLAPAGVIG